MFVDARQMGERLARVLDGRGEILVFYRGDARPNPRQHGVEFTLKISDKEPLGRLTQSRLTEGFDHAVERHKRPDLIAAAVQGNAPAGQGFKGNPVHQRVESARAVVAKNVRRPQERKRNAGRRSGL